MKTTLKNMVATLIIALLPALSGIMQAAAVNYKNNYRGVQMTEYHVQAVSATAPTVTFQSTSAYSSQWNQDEQQSMLNADGTVNNDAYMSALPRNSIRRAPGSPTGDLDPNAQQPLGDAVLPLLLCALAFCGVVYLRKRKAQA